MSKTSKTTGKKMTTEAAAVAIPQDQRLPGCECKSNINTFDGLVSVIKEAQAEYKAQWAAFEETAKLLESFGWKHGVGVMDEYNIGSYDEKDPYQLSWVVQEGVYLATGYGVEGDLNGGYQEGDFFVANTPLIDEGLQHILANPRCQRTKLNEEQKAQLCESFNQAYRIHLRFVAPTSRIYTFIHEKLGEYASSIGIPPAIAEELTDWLWEFRHECNGTDEKWTPTAEAKELLELLTKAQPLVKSRSMD